MGQPEHASQPRSKRSTLSQNASTFVLLPSLKRPTSLGRSPTVPTNPALRASPTIHPALILQFRK